MDQLRDHWQEFVIEAACLALFMVSACGFGVLLEHPASPVHRAIAAADVRRLLMGSAMGLTAIALIYSPLGKRSGAHMNPAVTLTFWRLRKLGAGDAAGYVLAQFVGGFAGVLVMAELLGARLADPAVHYVATVPGRFGPAGAFVGEVLISAAQMGIVLAVSNSRRSRYTGVFAGVGVATWIYWVGPISGMSMNPARTLGSAVVAGEWRSIWVYFTAPPLGMLAACEMYRRALRAGTTACAKLHHVSGYRCIFCEHAARQVPMPLRGSRGSQGSPRSRLVAGGEPLG